MKYQLLIAEYASAPWAILPERLSTLAHVIRQRAMGERIALEPLRTREEPEAGETPGVALVNVHGTIFNRSLIAAQSGFMTAQQIEADMRAAADARDVREIVVSVDSPGGVALNIDEAAEAVRYAASLKPVTVVANGYMASAAYWIGSQGSRVIATPLSAIGSIGVISSHADYSRYFENEGVDLRIYRTASQKALGQPTDPNDETMAAHELAELNAILRVFAADVARGRDMSVEEVLERYALDSDHPEALRGGTVLGAEAVRLGLADEVGTLNGALRAAIERTAARPARARKLTMRERRMNEVIEALEQGTLEAEQLRAGITAARESAANAERHRIAALLGVDDPSDTNLEALRAEAHDGRQYRADLLEQLEQAVVRVEGNSDAGRAAAERARRLYQRASITDLRDEVARLEAKAAALVPDGRRSKEPSDQDGNAKRLPSTYYGG